MKNTKDLLKEAIADAKAVRETALTQAKLALEEAFAPRLQSMFAAKLQENYDEDIDMEESMTDDIPEGNDRNDHNRMEEIDLDEILAELDKELNEAKDDDEEEIIDAEEDVEDIEDDAKEEEREDLT